VRLFSACCCGMDELELELALKLHPDKNHAPRAEEAFKGCLFLA